MRLGKKFTHKEKKKMASKRKATITLKNQRLLDSHREKEPSLTWETLKERMRINLAANRERMANSVADKELTWFGRNESIVVDLTK